MSQHIHIHPGLFYRPLMACVALALILIGSAFGQTTQFTYQCRLTDSGNPADGLYDTQFKLFDSADFVTGTQQGPTINLPSVQVANGVLTVQLNFGAAVFSGEPRFLEIGLRPAGSPGPFTVLGPRQPVTATPYAMRSASAVAADTAANATNATNATNAAQLGGISASQYVVTTDVRLSDARPPTADSPNYVQNTTSQQASTDFNISGNGTAGGTISANVVRATTQYNIGGTRVLSVAGSNNLFVGLNAGLNNSTGTDNSFFGSTAGQANQVGRFNAFFGTQAGVSNTASNNSFFGYLAGDDNMSGSENSFFGALTAQTNRTGSRNSFFGFNAGQNNISGSDNTFIGANVDVTDFALNFATAIGAGAVVNNSNSVVLGRSADTVRVPGLLSVSGATTLTGLVTVGSLGLAGPTAVCRNASNQLSTCSSSLRYKEHISTFTSGLELINRLRPITFTWKQGGLRDLGLVAEEVAEVEPLLVTHNDKGQVEGVKYDRITIVLINAIRQQQEQIEREQAENNVLKSDNDGLRQQLKQQEERLRRVEAAMEAMREAKNN